MNSEQLIKQEIQEIQKLLLAKNEQYGNSALDPLRVFSRANPTEQLKIRIDDKLSRLQRGQNNQEDTILDLIGYLVLLRVANKSTPKNLVQKRNVSRDKR